MTQHRASAHTKVLGPLLQKVSNTALMLPCRSRQVLVAEVRYLVCGLPGTALPDSDLIYANLDSVDSMVADSLDTCTIFGDQTSCTRDQHKSPFEGAGKGVPPQPAPPLIGFLGLLCSIQLTRWVQACPAWNNGDRCVCAACRCTTPILVI